MSVRTRGTTLVELLLALALVAIFSGALLGAMAGGSFKVERARQRAVALGLARELIEGQRVLARSGTIATGTTNVVVARANGVGPFATARTITAITTGGITNLFRVNSLVTWTNNEGSGERVELELWIRDDDE